MQFYTFGQRERPVILLMPGTCCHWKRNFGHVISLLEHDFYVVCVSYDGFDETEQALFPDMLTETQRIESYIQSQFNGHICAAYGCSMGGSLVGLMIQRGRVHIDHGILGSSDLDQSGRSSALVQAWLISNVLYGIFQSGRLPDWMQKRLGQKAPEEQACLEQLLHMFGVGTSSMAFVKKESIRNQFYSDLITPLEDHISVPGTVVHIFYALKMGRQYEARYRRHFKDPDIRRHDLFHEQLLVCQPEQWAEEVCSCALRPSKNISISGSDASSILSLL